jgi:hypothetical protein
VVVTEEEWLEYVRPLRMLNFIHPHVSDRKLRLIACATVRQIWESLADARYRHAVKVAELFADGETTPIERQAAFNSARDAAEEFRRNSSWTTWKYGSLVAAANTCYFRAYIAAKNCIDSRFVKDSFSLQTANLIREIIGNPFHPVIVDPRWLTSSVVDLARSIYEADPRQAGGYMNLPILADALMDAGCDSEELLNHCRSEGLHVRGCWAVDLILGKS